MVPILQILAVTGISHLKFGVCTEISQHRFDIPKQIKVMNTGSHPPSNKFLLNVIRAGEAEQCPACTEALYNFEDFHVESLKKIGVEPSNEIRLAEMELKLKTELERRLAEMAGEMTRREAKITKMTAELTTLKTDIAPLLLRRALNVAVQAALVIAGVQPKDDHKDPIPPCNRFRYLLSSNQDFKDMFQRIGHLDDQRAWTKCKQIDGMVWSRNQIEHPTDMVKFKAEVVDMVSVLTRYDSKQAEHKTALWVLRRFHAMSAQPFWRKPGKTS